MDLEFSAEENRFRVDVQAFLQSSLPAHISNKVRNGIRLTRADLHVLYLARSSCSASFKAVIDGRGQGTARAPNREVGDQRVPGAGPRAVQTRGC